MTAPATPSRRTHTARAAAILTHDLGRTDAALAALLGITTAELSPVIGRLYRGREPDPV